MISCTEEDHFFTEHVLFFPMAPLQDHPITGLHFFVQPKPTEPFFAPRSHFSPRFLFPLPHKLVVGVEEEEEEMIKMDEEDEEDEDEDCSGKQELGWPTAALQE